MGCRDKRFLALDFFQSPISIVIEVGKKDQKVLEKFLEKHTLKMPRTMLRYSIVNFPEKKRQYYLKKK